MKKILIAILLLTSSMAYAVPERFKIDYDRGFKRVHTFVKIDYKSEDETKSYGFKEILKDDGSIETYSFVIEKKLTDIPNCSFLINDADGDNVVTFQEVTYDEENKFYKFKSYFEDEKYYVCIFLYVPAQVIHEKNIDDAFFAILLKERVQEDKTCTEKI